jgi:hypothetical protein
LIGHRIGGIGRVVSAGFAQALQRKPAATDRRRAPGITGTSARVIRPAFLLPDVPQWPAGPAALAIDLLISHQALTAAEGSAGRLACE